MPERILNTIVGYQHSSELRAMSERIKTEGGVIGHKDKDLVPKIIEILGDDKSIEVRLSGCAASNCVRNTASSLIERGVIVRVALRECRIDGQDEGSNVALTHLARRMQYFVGPISDLNNNPLLKFEGMEEYPKWQVMLASAIVKLLD